MTTVIATRKCMASDRLITSMHTFNASKIFRVHGSLIGVAGPFEQCLKFIEWRRNPDLKPTFSDAVSLEALELSSDGQLTWWGAEMVAIPIDSEFYAIGSGAAYALGAMAMRASPRRAIEVAARYDSSTGSDVQIMNLGAK